MPARRSLPPTGPHVPWRRHWMARVVGSLLAVGLSAVVRGLLNPILHDQTPFMLFTPAVVFAAFYGGLVPGLLATLASIALCSLLWIAPIGSLYVSAPHELVHMAVFAGVGVAMSLMGDLMRRTRTAAEAASRAKDDFIAVLSHELRTPLTPAMLTVNALADDPALPAPIRSDLHTADRNLQLLARLMDDLLDANRIVRDKLELVRMPCDLHAIMAHAIRVCSSDLTRKKLTLEVDLGAAQHWVDGDPARLQQVLWNLLRNAAKFTPQGGTIAVRSRNQGAQVLVSVVDKGAGIRPDDLARIFQPFEQGAGQAGKRLGGLGLGLAISHALVERHGGTLSVLSEGPGRGATFTAALPVIATPALGGAGAASAAAAAATPPLRILLVEDHADTRVVMQRLLERAGHHVVALARVHEALAATDAETFDVLICDRGLPDGSGLDVMRHIRGRGTAGICLSGYGAPADLAASKLAGFAVHLTKPVQPAQLLATLARLAPEPAALAARAAGE